MVMKARAGSKQGVECKREILRERERERDRESERDRASACLLAYTGCDKINCPAVRCKRKMQN